jgi:hypothetical protein
MVPGTLFASSRIATTRRDVLVAETFKGVVARKGRAKVLQHPCVVDNESKRLVRHPFFFGDPVDASDGLQQPILLEPA